MIASTAAMLLFPKAVGYTPDIVQRLALRHSMVVLKPSAEVLPNIADLSGTPDYGYFTGLAAEIKAVSPRPARVLYCYGLANRESLTPDYAILDDADLLHRLDGTAVTITALQATPQFYPQRTKVVNLSRPETRRKLRAFWRAWLRDNDLDGVMFDTFQPDFYSAWLANQLGCPTGAKEGAVHTPLWWAQTLSTFCRELRFDLELDGRQLWVNGLDPNPQDPTTPAHQLLGPGFVGAADCVTGVLDEFLHPVHGSADALKAFITRAQTVVAKRRGYLAVFQPKLFEITEPAHVWTAGPPLARFYLGAYLLISEPSYTRVAYHDGPPYIGMMPPTPPHHPYLYDGGADWDLDLGMPTNGVQWNLNGASPVAYRQFGTTVVAVNPGPGYGQLVLSPGTYHDWAPGVGGTVVITTTGQFMNVGPGNSLVLFKEVA